MSILDFFVNSLISSSIKNSLLTLKLKLFKNVLVSNRTIRKKENLNCVYVWKAYNSVKVHDGSFAGPRSLSSH